MDGGINLIIEILAQRYDPRDSYFFGDFPSWVGWIAGLFFMAGVVLFYVDEKVGGNWARKLSIVSIGFGVWLPLILINLDRPVVLIIVTALAIYFCRSSFRDEFPTEEKEELGGEIRDGKAEGPWVDWYDPEEKNRKKRERIFKNDKLVSVEVWKPNGEKCPETKVVDGNGVIVYYWDDGTELARLTCKDGEIVQD